MSRQLLTLFFLNILLNIAIAENVNPNNEIINLKNKLEVKFFEFSNSIVKWMKNINYNSSDYEKNIRLNELKSEVGNVGEGRAHKLLPLLLIPIAYKIGILSMLTILTAFLAAKSVAIGLILLVMKIVVSFAKMSSFFTIWKYKKYQNELAWPVYHGHHSYHDIHDHIHDHDHHAHDHNDHYHHYNDHYHHGNHVPIDMYKHNNYPHDWSSHPSLYVTPTSLPENEFIEKKVIKHR